MKFWKSVESFGKVMTCIISVYRSNEINYVMDNVSRVNLCSVIQYQLELA